MMNNAAAAWMRRAIITKAHTLYRLQALLLTAWRVGNKLTVLSSAGDRGKPAVRLYTHIVPTCTFIPLATYLHPQ